MVEGERGELMLAEYIVTRTVVERIGLVCPSEKRNEVYDELASDGWRVTRGGPYTDEKMWPTVDPTRCQIIAEREEYRS